MVNNEPIDTAHQIEDKSKKPSKKALWIVLVVLALAAMVIGLYWLAVGRHSISTTDAYIDGNITEVYPRIQGNIQTVCFNNTDYVEQGQVLVKLDPTPFELAFQESQTQLALAVRKTQMLYDQIDEIVAAIERQQILVDQAQIHFNNRQSLVDIGAVSKESYMDSEMALLASQAEMERLLQSLKTAQAETENVAPSEHPQVLQAVDQLKQAWLQLQYTTIKAPCNGYVANKNAQVGESASPSTSLLAVVPLDNLWVTANFKESQLSKLRIGQSVEVKADMYQNKQLFRGKIIGFAPGTGSVFSILPPQNATGNWIKIVQRVPVKIALKYHQLEQAPLRVGLSAKVKVDVSDQSGRVLTQSMSPASCYQTDVFGVNFSQIQPLINQIIQSNLSNGCPN